MYSINNVQFIAVKPIKINGYTGYNIAIGAVIG